MERFASVGRNIMDTSEQKVIHVAPREGQMRWVVGDLVTFKIGGEGAARRSRLERR